VVIHRSLFSSARADWETPPALYGLLNRQFSFTLDVCATRQSRKCRRYFSPAVDGLRQRWRGCCWMNPPYGRAIAAWVKKAFEEGRKGATVVCLLPARTDTAWWHDHVMKGTEIRLLKGRLTFVGAPSPAPFPSAVVVFRRNPAPAVAPRVVSWNWRAVVPTGPPAGAHHGRSSSALLS
jgi:site-specific DNA-methyltransferase (adenine-specific)